MNRLANDFRAKGRKLGLSIAGGGSRLGWLAGAASGLLYDEQLRKNVRAVYGSSAGAIVGAKAAQAVVQNKLEPLEQLARVIQRLTPLSFAGIGDMSIPDFLLSMFTGFESRDLEWGITDLVRENMSAADWRQLVRAGDRVRSPVELGICMTRKGTLESEIITTRGCRDSRTLTKALAASASIPGLFPAVEVYPDLEYVDGCVVDLNPAAFLAESDLAPEMDGIIIIGTTPVTDAYAPIRTPVSGVGERVGHALGLLEERATRAVPVVRIGPPKPLPGGPLDFDPAHMMDLWRYGFRYTLDLLGLRYPR